MIFFGPSGTGKTTVANICAQASGRVFYKLNATNASTKDIKEIVSELDTLHAGKGILLYLDEIQNFNKKQQYGFSYCCIFTVLRMPYPGTSGH